MHLMRLQAPTGRLVAVRLRSELLTQGFSLRLNLIFVNPSPSNSLAQWAIIERRRWGNEHRTLHPQVYPSDHRP